MISPSPVYRHFLKPVIDRIIAAIALILCAPMLIAIAAAVRIKLGSPILFMQLRPGRYGRSFRLYKFRTMIDARNESGQLLDDAKRLTPFGSWLRSSSLDELPELWNVLRGEMSLVGPRPLLTKYVELYSPRQHRRHEVKPGITGLFQVRGRNAIDWGTRLEMDVWYVDRVSISLDLRILLETVKCVLLRRGINADAHVTMPSFTGQPTPCPSSEAA